MDMVALNPEETHLQALRPGALYNETFAEHVRALSARRVRLEIL